MLIFGLQFKPVQTFVAKKAAKYLSQELKTQVSIKSLYLKPFKSIVLEGLFIQDQQKDTLLYAPKFDVDVSYFSLRERVIDFNNIQLDNTTFYLKKYKSRKTNLDFIINYFNSGNKKTTKKSKPFTVNLNKIVINNLDFRYKDFKVDTLVKNGINYNDLRLSNLSTTLVGLDTKNFILKTQINHLTFKEKSGFYLKDLTAATTIDTNKIELKELLILTNESRLSNYYSMSYVDFNDFSDYINKVKMKAVFENSRISSKDIAYFAPAIKEMNLDLGIEGNISGTVSNLRARKLAVLAGKATYLKGNFTLRGLPDIANTFMDLDFEQIATNKKDLDYILGSATAKKAKKLPAIINKFGNVNFSGQFTGFQNDFVAFGEFKTKLGRVISDVNMKIDKNNYPAYTGNIQAVDFDLGDLLDAQKTLGRTSFKASIKGQGTEVKNLKEQLDAKIAYIDFNKYRYENVNLNGTFNKRLFDGKFTVNDRNLKLSFDGSVNLNPKLPVFAFKSNIQSANLFALKLLKDTIIVDANFATNFKGNNLDNIEGDLSLNQIRITNTETSYLVDSVYLIAKGQGYERLLSLSSDIGDASIKGQYDLATLPSAFKTIVKKYIPSLQAKIIKPKSQNFQFSLDLKNFDPVTALFMPQLQIPERGAFNGSFNSAKDSVNLNGFVKTINYNKYVLQNLIIDQNTNAKSLDATISLDKLNITDSLYIKNIVIQNSLKNDSLAYNIKLSDKDATNQLDLYGLVEFGTDTTAELSLLPSDIVIDREVWKIEDQVKIKFDNNKVNIEGFELKNKEQLLTINGLLSKDKNDLLDINFKDFSLTSFSQATKGFGINLTGDLNGKVEIYAALDNPRIESDLGVDQFFYNKTRIGDVKLQTTFDNEAKDISVDMNIMNAGLQTLNVKGHVNINSDIDNLDLDVELNKTELVIFSPFVQKLVSRLKGQISSDIKITGRFQNPQINGTAELINAGLTVNYLKTAYTISDKVAINNSIIEINDFKLKDAYNHQAIANGTVNLKDPSVPIINVVLNATRFMALNTTAKDNPVYYGTAFGTGVFRFNGPTDAMRININAKTEEGTVFTIPLNRSSTVGVNDFITYVAKDSVLTKDSVTNEFNGLTMEFNLTVDEKSTANILTDVGNLTGAGNAQLRLRITSLGDFEMTGDYVINNGKFDFTANNVINKTFDIRQGGTIRWTGDPAAAIINLNAVYATRAQISPLYQAAGRNLPDEKRNETALAEAEMILSESLLAPKIDFDLEFPNNTGIRTDLQGYLENKDNKAQQVISLIVRRNFDPNTGNALGFNNADITGIGLELAFSKINNIISESLNIKNLDINVRSQNEFGGSYSFFNNRLRITGNFVNNRFATSNTDILSNNILSSGFQDLTRDLEMTLNINQDGSFVAKAFQRPANRDFLNINRDLYINGLGLVYTQEYDTFSEFIKNMLSKKRKKERSNPISQQPAIMPPGQENDD